MISMKKAAYAASLIGLMFISTSASAIQSGRPAAETINNRLENQQFLIKKYIADGKATRQQSMDLLENHINLRGLFIQMLKDDKFTEEEYVIIRDKVSKEYKILFSIRDQDVAVKQTDQSTPKWSDPNKETKVKTTKQIEIIDLRSSQVKQGAGDYKFILDRISGQEKRYLSKLKRNKVNPSERSAFLQKREAILIKLSKAIEDGNYSIKEHNILNKDVSNLVEYITSI